MPEFYAPSTAPNSFTLRACSAFVCVRIQYFFCKHLTCVPHIVMMGSQIIYLDLLHIVSSRRLLKKFKYLRNLFSLDLLTNYEMPMLDCGDISVLILLNLPFGIYLVIS
jgi:hypothetical protein